MPPPGLTAADRNEWERVWRRVVADPAIKLVGWTAASWADPDGTRIFPGARKLAASTGLAETTVKNALAVIRQAGLFWRYVEGSKHGRGGVADEYRLTVPGDILDRVPMLTPETYELTGTGRLRTRDLRTRVLSVGNRSPEAPEQVGPGDATTTAPLHSPLHVENTAASRRGRTAGQRGPRDGIDPEFIGDVAEELIGELKANADEAGTVTGMLEHGEHPKAVRNMVSAQRFGPRSERRRSGPACEHGRPYATDRWTDCQPPCYLGDPAPAAGLQPGTAAESALSTAELFPVPDDNWPPPEPADPWGDPW